MTQVLVELDDLEKLVFTSGAMKQVEEALRKRREDPFVRDHLEFTEAHNRLALAMRDARRNPADVYITHDEPLEKEELKLLRQLWDDEGNNLLPWFEVPASLKTKGKDGNGISTLDRLMIKRCIRIGQLARAVVWPGEAQAQLIPSATGFAVQFTAKGLAILNPTQ